MLGGRSRSWQDPRSGDIEDNGQHLVMGCYEEFLAFVRRTGGAEQLEFQDRFGVVLVEPGGRAGSFAPGRLPRPLDLLWGLLRLNGFPLKDALGAGKLMRDLRRETALPADLAAADWLRSGGQSAEARRRFWDPLILATLNLPADRAPANLLAVVLRRALLGGPAASRLGFAGRGLSGLIVTPSLDYLRRSGGQVRSGVPVRHLERDGSGRCAGVRTRDEEVHRAGAVILAVPHREAAELLDGLGGDFDRAGAARLGASPIVAVHLWFDRQVSPYPLAALIDSPIHWVFDRGRIGGAQRAGVSGAGHQRRRRPGRDGSTQPAAAGPGRGAAPLPGRARRATAAGARTQGATRHTGPGCAGTGVPSRHAYGGAGPVPGWRLDRHRSARHAGRRRRLGASRGRTGRRARELNPRCVERLL